MEIQENKKSPEVDLDTDGVNEQSVQVEEQKTESTEPELPKEEVDLGYTESKKEGIEGIQLNKSRKKKNQNQKLRLMIYPMFPKKLKEELIN